MCASRVRAGPSAVRSLNELAAPSTGASNTARRLDDHVQNPVSIRYSGGPNKSTVEYFLDGVLFTTVNHVGIPLDRQQPPVPFTGYAPSLGAGEELSINSFSIGHGLFSLLDAFPYQHSARPDLRVSIPTSERIFGQGANGTWKNFQVTTTTN